MQILYPNPPCTNHPDRVGHAFYRHPDDPKKVGEVLCMECLEVRLNLRAKQTIEEHAAECKFLDQLAIMFGNGEKVVYESERGPMQRLRRK